MTEQMKLNDEGLIAARKSLDDGAVTPAYGPHRESIIKLLNDSLATELVCVLRYKRHHFMASGLASPKIAEEFMVHAKEESDHADRIAKRIVQLGCEYVLVTGTQPWKGQQWRLTTTPHARPTTSCQRTPSRS